jgi:pyridoxamine 5'-phosphate oxidase
VTIRDQLQPLPVFDRPLPDFDPDQVPDEPVSLFARWLGEAIDAKVVEPHAMTLSTADAQGHPDARVLLLRDVSPAGPGRGRVLAGRSPAPAHPAALPPRRRRLGHRTALAVGSPAAARPSPAPGNQLRENR